MTTLYEFLRSLFPFKGYKFCVLDCETDVLIGLESRRKTGNAGMTVGGTGDVLAGLCAGYLAQTNSLFASACAAAYNNGKYGDELLQTKGYGFIASDIVKKIKKLK